MQLLEPDAQLPEFCRKPILILGCGNVLFGDDGFGPAVMCWLEEHWRGRIPDDVCMIDAGTGVRTMLFTLTLSERRPQKLIIVDAVDVGRKPGEIFALEVDDLPARKIDDFSMHQLPTSNLLKELQVACGTDVRILSCQVENVPESVSPGLSEAVQTAVPRVGEMILESLARHE